jgi:ATP-dependent exoDNAse (exonuclease V) alpha subunit
VTRYFTINGIGYSRTQYPLQNAFALTVHKTQSLSIDNLSVSLDSSLFSVGQAYTALSRGTSLEGMSIMHLDRAAFMVDEEAVKEQGVLEARWRRFANMRRELRGNGDE